MLCLQQVWFGWEKHCAGRWEPEHIGRLVPDGTLEACRTQVKTHGRAGWKNLQLGGYHGSQLPLSKAHSPCSGAHSRALAGVVSQG